MNDIIKLTYKPEGKERMTMEFWWREDAMRFVEICSKPSQIKLKFLSFLRNGRMNIWHDDRYVTDSLNPLYLEFIMEEECPECEKNERSGIDIGMSDKEFGNRRRNSGLPVMKNHFCTDGKVSVSTGFYSFKGKEEYDEVLKTEQMAIL